MGRKSRDKQARVRPENNRESAAPETRLSPAKAAVFLVITIALPFILLALLEAGLRIANYGGDTRAFVTPEVLGSRYLVPGSNIGKRYFP